MHCWCPPATGPNQPHEPGCSRYKRLIVHATIGSYHDWEPEGESEGESDPFFDWHGLPYQTKLSVTQAQAYNAALQWLDKQNPAPRGAPIKCTCAAKYGVIGHAAFCPLGERAESDAASAGDAAWNGW